MAVVNIGAILEYGKAVGMVRGFGALVRKREANTAGGTLQAQAEMAMIRVMVKKVAAGVPGAVVRPVAMAEEGMDVDDEGRGINLLPSQLQKRHQMCWHSNMHSGLPSLYFLSYSRHH